MARPLEGLSVLDLTNTLAGSYCTKLWVDAGADVLKIEPPGGDPLRRRRVVGSPASTGDHSPLSSFLHAGKGSIVADVTTRAGRATVLDLAASADLLVESADPGTLAARGLGPRDLRAANPELTVVSITPFGQTGPWAQRPATEFTLQAASGSIGGRGTPERHARGRRWATGGLDHRHVGRHRGSGRMAPGPCHRAGRPRRRLRPRVPLDLPEPVRTPPRLAHR